MNKISTGIKDLDRLMDCVYIGDNVIWEVEAGTSPEAFVRSFIRQASEDGQKIIYLSFNKSPQSILQQIGKDPGEGFVFLDCFTSGKGRSDKAFLRFYENRQGGVTLVERPGDISFFTNILNSIEDGLPSGARYVFDSLTGMQDLWGGEDETYKFFTYMCPRLYDLGTVAYWILEKEAHSQTFKANLRHVTQVVLDLYKKRDGLYIKALKLDGRKCREAFKPHPYRFDEGEIGISSVRSEPAFDIGTKIREIRLGSGMSQKELAERIGLTPSFISQLESNQISPSLNSFLQICGALGVGPNEIWKEVKTAAPRWLIRKQRALSNVEVDEKGLRGFGIAANGNVRGSIFVIEPDTVINRHLTEQKGRQIIHVLKGAVMVSIDGRQEKLIAGDSVYLKDEIPAMWKNQGGDRAELLIVSF